MSKPPPQGYRDNAPEAAPVRAAEPDVAAQRALAVARQEEKIVALEAERARLGDRLDRSASLGVVLFFGAVMVFVGLVRYELDDRSLMTVAFLLVAFGVVMVRGLPSLFQRLSRDRMARLDQQLVDARAKYHERMLIAALPLGPEPRLRVSLAAPDGRHEDDARLEEEVAAARETASPKKTEQT